MSDSDSFKSMCMKCKEWDDEDMVQCDNCVQWAHYRCVGVGPEIANLDWCCRYCRIGLYSRFLDLKFSLLTLTPNTIEKLIFSVTRFKDNEK